MSKGLSGLFRGTMGSKAAAGSSMLMNPSDDFVRNIANRRDVDANGYYDVVAHGSPDSILVYHKGANVRVTHRVLARILRHDEKYNGQAIRLLSCSTGSSTGHFAQDLANNLGVPVKAPTDILWAWPQGGYRVAGKKRVGDIDLPDTSKPGKFTSFYPRRRKLK